VKIDSDAQKFRKRALQHSNGAVADGFVLQHGVLFYRLNGMLRVYVPKQLRTALNLNFVTSQLLVTLAGRKHIMHLHSTIIGVIWHLMCMVMSRVVLRVNV
jgi:hypothetical protein